MTSQVLADKPQATNETTGKDGALMVLVPAGKFLYGKDNHPMSLSAFHMDKYEVTTSRYARFLEQTSREKPRYWNDMSLLNDGDRPVIGVAWLDADAYCRHYGKRLPTEHEWEKAARGTDGRKYPWGNEKPTSQHANFGKCCDRIGYSMLTGVGGHEAGKSPYGIYDMAGNVWEWTSSDCDNRRQCKVGRGGSWGGDAYGLLSTTQLIGDVTSGGRRLGFRCAMDAPK